MTFCHDKPGAPEYIYLAHDWDLFMDGNVLDENDNIIEKCKVCGYQTDWFFK